MSVAIWACNMGLACTLTVSVTQIILCASLVHLPGLAIFIVSPELSSGRDFVIQMSVRRAASAVHGFLSGAYLGIRMTYLDDIWYVGGSRSEVAHAEFWAWQMPIKYLICIIYAKICPEHFSGTVCPTWMIFGMWVGLGRRCAW